MLVRFPPLVAGLVFLLGHCLGAEVTLGAELNVGAERNVGADVKGIGRTKDGLATGQNGVFRCQAGKEEEWLRFSRTEARLGTRVTIVVGSQSEKAAQRAITAGFARIGELDAILSDYRMDSELSQLCETAPHDGFVPISVDLLTVLKVSHQVSRQSGGAFDVTIGPVTKLWRRARRRKEMPSNDLLTNARKAVGYRMMELQDKPPGARLKVANMRLDLGGVAKGYIVDQVLAVLKEQGVERALVNAGGDIGVSLPPAPMEKGWRVAVAPLKKDQQPTRLLLLAQQAIATSGDAFQSLTIDGKRYSHIVDPRTGLGVTRQSSVTVIAPSADLADAWASALSVLAPKEGLAAFPKKPGFHAQIVVASEKGQPVVTRTKGYPAGHPIKKNSPHEE